MDFRQLFLTSQGRIGPRDFWIGFLILFVSGIVLGLIPFLGLIASIALIYPQVCIFSKRLHDFGKSGWLYLAPLILTVLLGVVMAVVGGASLAMLSGEDDGAAIAGAALAIGGLIVLLNFGFLLWVGLSRGDPGENRYGPPPGMLAASVF